MIKKIAFAFLTIAILGAGCQPAVQPYSPPAKTEPVPAKQGFGKIPSIARQDVLGSREAMSGSASSVSAPATPAAPTAPAAPMANGSAPMMVTDAAAPIRIMPPPIENVKVNYTVTATLPAWNAEGDVYRIRLPNIDASIARSIISTTGIPSQIANSIASVQYANVSWKDNDGFIWNTDIPSRNLSWWKEVDYSIQQPRERRQVSLDKERVLAVADGFLRSHGLTDLGQGSIQEYPEIMPLLRGESMPCILNEFATEADRKEMIYPSPCGFPMQVSVVYNEMRGGLPVVGSGGWPFSRASVSVDIETNTVLGGNVMQTQAEDKSAYPMISSEEAMKRLNAGGNNPVYGWYGPEGSSDINVTITSAKLGWMHHDTWENNQTRSFILPALIAEGTVNRGIKGQEPEKYYTVVPLVADEAFQMPVNPVPMPFDASSDPGFEPGL